VVAPPRQQPRRKFFIGLEACANAADDHARAQALEILRCEGGCAECFGARRHRQRRKRVGAWQPFERPNQQPFESRQVELRPQLADRD